MIKKYLQPISDLLDSPEVSEIMVNGVEPVYVEIAGKLTPTDARFNSEDELVEAIRAIARITGRAIDERNPLLDSRLPDGSRVNAVLRPVAVSGPTLTIRKFSKNILSVTDLIRSGSLNHDAAHFLEKCVKSRANILVAGGTGSGKATLLNILSGYIPENERIITIEDVAELRLTQPHRVSQETRPISEDDAREITIRDLVKNALRMRPDRIIVGEVRGGEALDMLQAMNTGHDGSLTTLHANSPRDALSRLETMVLFAGIDLPLRAIRQQIASAIDLIIFIERMRDASRRITAITELQGLQEDAFTLQDVFKFEEFSGDGGRIMGELKASGLPANIAKP